MADSIRAYVRHGRLEILDVGCGTGALLREVEAFGNARGIDMSPEAIQYCQRRGLSNVQQGSITNIPFPDNCFDVVMALDVLEHVADDQNGLAEVFRVLKPGGHALLFVPAFRSLWSITDELSHHFRRYTRPEFSGKVAAAGLQIVRSSYFNTFLFLPIALVRLFVRWRNIKLSSEERLMSPLLNRLFFIIFRLESLVFNYVNFPFGISVYILAAKP